MPTSYGDRTRIPALKGRVRGGLAVVAHTPGDLAALQQLVWLVDGLPGEALANLYRVIRNAGPKFAAWTGFSDVHSQQRADPRPPARREVEFAPLRDRRAQALHDALVLTESAWRAQREPGELACALIVPRPGRRAAFETKRPSLTMDYGSLRARVLTAGGAVRAFGVSLFPTARSIRQIDIRDALHAHAVGRGLPSLETLQPSDFADKDGVVVFLHGLMSTDIGTFDQFVARLQQGEERSLVLTAWRHDTLDPIALNAEELAAQINTIIGPTTLPIAFVCHSRGGLVARRTIVELLEADRRWSMRLRGCVTFGTPHNGAELAEKGDQLLGKLLLLGTLYQSASYPQLFDALWTVKQFGKLPGVRDLRPPKNGGKFLRRLAKAEGRLAGGPGTFPVPILAIGGNAAGGTVYDRLARRFFRNVPNDLIVATRSSAPAGVRSRAETACDHFGYFLASEAQKGHVADAVRFLDHALATGANPGPPIADSSAARPRRSKGRPARDGEPVAV